MPRAKAETIPYTLDERKLMDLPVPLGVKVYRERQDGSGEPISLDNNGQGWDHDRIKQIETGIPGLAGGGTYLCIVTSATGQEYKWKFYIPGAPIVTPDNRAQVAQADLNSRAAAAQVAANLSGVGGSPLGPQLPFVMPQGANMANQPPQQAPQLGLQQPQQYVYVPGMGYMAMPAPAVPAMAPSMGMMMPGMMPGMMPWWQGQQPNWPPPTTTGGRESAAMDAVRMMQEKLAEQERRHEMERQERRQQEMMNEIRQQRAEDNKRFETMMEKLVAGRPESAALEAERRAREEDRRKHEQDFRDAEQKRRDDEFKRSIEAHQQQTRAMEERFRSELQAAKEAGNTSLMHEMMKQQADWQRQNAAEQRSTLEKFMSSQPSLLDSIRTFREIAGGDGLDHDIKKMLIERGLNPPSSGEPSIPGVIGDLGNRALEAAEKIGATIIESKAAAAQAQALGSSAAAARFNSIRQQQTDQVAKQRALRAQQEQAAGELAGPPQSAPQQQPTATVSAQPEPVSQAPETEQAGGGNGARDDEDADDMSDEEYFGPAIGYIKILRRHVASGMTPVQAAQLIGVGYTQALAHNAITPAMEDIEQDPEEFVERLLPEADAGYMGELIDAIKTHIAAIKAQFAAAAKAEGIATPTEPEPAKA